MFLGIRIRFKLGMFAGCNWRRNVDEGLGIGTRKLCFTRMGVRMKLTAGVLCSSLAWSEISEIGWTRNYDSVAWHRNHNWTYNDLQGSSKLNNDLQWSAKLIMNSDLIQSLKDLEGTGKVRRSKVSSKSRTCTYTYIISRNHS